MKFKVHAPKILDCTQSKSKQENVSDLFQIIKSDLPSFEKSQCLIKETFGKLKVNLGE